MKKKNIGIFVCMLLIVTTLSATGNIETDNMFIENNVNGKWIGGKVDLEEVIAGGESSSYYLQALDIVYVPETHIYEVNRWVEQHISRIMPEVGIGLSFADGQLLGTTVGITVNPSERPR